MTALSLPNMYFNQASRHVLDQACPCTYAEDGPAAVVGLLADHHVICNLDLADEQYKEI
jgi:hypothetical protein